MAEELRQQAQKQTPAQRKASIARGMAIINAGPQPTTRQACEAVLVIADRIQRAIPEYAYEMNLVRRALGRKDA
jgi:hypothetical protein